MSPQRIQRKRTKGWRMPEGAVYVGRPSRWGNIWGVGDPYPWGDHHRMTRADVVEVYEYGLTGSLGWQAEAATLLRGKDLACWCPLDEPCHADVLLRIASGEVIV